MTELNNEWLEKIFKPPYWREFEKLRRLEPRVELYIYNPGKTQEVEIARNKRIYKKLQPWVTQFCKRSRIEVRFSEDNQITFLQE